MSSVCRQQEEIQGMHDSLSTRAITEWNPLPYVITTINDPSMTKQEGNKQKTQVRTTGLVVSQLYVHTQA